jgi:hypothetical protein
MEALVLQKFYNLVKRTPDQRSLIFGQLDECLSIKFEKFRGSWDYGRGEWRTGPQTFNLRALLLISARLQCSDGRNKVYGVLGLAEGASEKIKIDYRKPAAKVFLDALKALWSLNAYRNTWSKQERDKIYTLALAMGVKGTEVGFTDHLAMAQFKNIFHGRSPAEGFKFVICSVPSDPVCTNDQVQSS